MSKFLRIFCYPAYIDATNIGMPELSRRMQIEGVGLLVMRWDGTLKGLPKDRSAVIRYSSMLDIDHSKKAPAGIKFASSVATMNAVKKRQRTNKTDGATLQKFCEQFGHIIIYEDRIIRNEEDPWEDKPSDDIESLWAALAPFIQEE